MEEDRCKDPQYFELLGAYELGLLSDEEKTSVEEHILHCNICFEDLYDTAPLSHMVSSNTLRKRVQRKKWYFPVLAAATLILAFTATLHFMQNKTSVKRGNQSTGSAITLTEPKGTLKETRISFSWVPSVDASSYTVIVFNEIGDSIWSYQTNLDSVQLDIVEDERFEQNRTYFWKVEARNENGRLLSTSTVSSFLIEAN